MRTYSVNMNKLTATGSPGDIARVRARLSRPAKIAYNVRMPSDAMWVTMKDRLGPVFLLWNIVNPEEQPPECMDNYTEVWSQTKDWNLKHWGVEEEVTVPRLEFVDDTTIVYTFNSDQATPGKAFIALSTLFPDVVFSLEASRPSGKRATITYTYGMHKDLKEFSAPTSHRVFEKIRGKDSCVCYEIHPPVTLPFFDCPRVSYPTERAVDLMNYSSRAISDWKPRV